MEIIKKPWQGTSEEILQKLESSQDGLTDFEAQKRLFKFGANSIARQTPIPYLQIFFNQFEDLLVLLLIFAALLSFILGDFRNGIILSIIVFINAIIGFSQEYKAEKILRALTKYLPSMVKVKRAGEEKQIDSRYLVPGDICILGQGDKVPADLRLLEAYDLKTNDQALTGEAKPQTKAVKNYPQDNVSLVEVENCLFMGTLVVDGEALAVVTSTGLATEFGKIAQKTIQIDKSLSPLQVKTRRMAKRIAILAALVVIALVIYKYFLGRDILDALTFSIAVAAALVPEGLPATISVALSLGARNLASRQALVKNLVSVETLGSVTVICTDKTGTLTTGQMEVKEIWDKLNPEINEEERQRLITEIFVLCSDAQVSQEQEFGDPMELALLRWVEKQGIDWEKIRHQNQKVAEIPFNSRRRFMSVTYRNNSGQISTYLKGAPEVIIEKCLINNEEKAQILAKFKDFAREGFRVLALAYNHIFLGLVAIFDPPRKEIKEALAACHQGHIRVIMITGDNALTATSIAKMVGIIHNNSQQPVIEGGRLDLMSDIEIRSILQKEPIFARTLPEQKYRIVDNLMQMGEIVAVTGDGVNDAPALKRADIGIAMGKTGTDVSREAADLVLLDDNFATIVQAIKEGRTIFDNIKKFLFYIFSSNFGELLTVVLGMIFGLPLPLTAVQILSIDLGTDVLPSMSLIGEPPEGEVMKSNPRSKEVQLLTGESFIHLTLVGLVMGIGAIWNFMTVRNLGLSYHSATTASLATLVIAQAFNVFLSRSPNTTIFRYPFWKNKWLIFSVLSSLVLVVLFVYTQFFHKNLLYDSFPSFIWIRAILIGLILLIAEEIYKIIKRNVVEK